MIILRQEDLKKFVKVAHGRNFGGEHMLGGGETAPIFVGEHAWDTGAVKTFGYIDLPEKFHGISYCVPSVRLAVKRGEYDFSSASEKTITAPNGDLVDAMMLHVEEPFSFTFVGKDGRAAFIDVEATRPDVEKTLIRAASLEQVLAAQNLCPVWIFWSEKDGGLGHGPNFASRDSQVSRTVFGGCYWRENGAWKTSGEWLVTKD